MKKAKLFILLLFGLFALSTSVAFGQDDGDNDCPVYVSKMNINQTALPVAITHNESITGDVVIVFSNAVALQGITPKTEGVKAIINVKIPPNCFLASNTTNKYSYRYIVRQTYKPYLRC
jgi:hypothetical protein